MRQPATACTIAYKILTAPQWAELSATGSFAGAPVDLADGYIHMSTADQVTDTFAKHFAGQTDLVIAAVDLTHLGESLRWEISRGGAFFPHLYGALPLASVIAQTPLRCDGAGAVVLPIPAR